jgi:hypothetical protein
MSGVERRGSSLSGLTPVFSSEASGLRSRLTSFPAMLCEHPAGRCPSQCQDHAYLSHLTITMSMAMILSID